MPSATSAGKGWRLDVRALQVFSVLILFLNVILVIRLHRAEVRLDQYRIETGPPIGLQLLPIKASDVRGNQLTLPVTGRPTLLLVLSPSCVHCKANWPNWQELIRFSQRFARFGFIDISSTITGQYIDEHQIGAYPVLKRVAIETLRLFRLTATPETIVVGPEGRIEKAWVGELSSEDVKQVEGILAAVAARSTSITSH